jgi:hypothetical protein
VRQIPGKLTAFPKNADEKSSTVRKTRPEARMPSTAQRIETARLSGVLPGPATAAWLKSLPEEEAARWLDEYESPALVKLSARNIYAARRAAIRVDPKPDQEPDQDTPTTKRAALAESIYAARRRQIGQRVQ